MRVAQRKHISVRALLGFACHQGFLLALFYAGDNRAIEVFGLVIERVDLLLTFLSMAFAFLFVSLVSRKVRNALLAPTLVGWYAVLLVLGSLLIVLPDQASLPELLAAGVLMGLPSGLLVCAWARALFSAPVHLATIQVLGGSGIAALFCLIVLALPFEGALRLCSLLPIGSAWALRSLSLTESHLDTLPSQRQAANRLSLRAVAGTALFGLAGGFMETFASEPGMLAAPAFSATLLICAFFCLAALQFILPTLASRALASKKEAATETFEEGGSQGVVGVYRLAVLVIMAGYLFSPVLGNFNITGESIALAGYVGLVSVLLCVFSSIAKLRGLDPAINLARGFCALYLGEVFGIILGNAVELYQTVNQPPWALAACAGLASLYAYLFLFTENDVGELGRMVQKVDYFEKTCEEIITRYELSKREAEVLPLALRGRTSERIASELFIAKSTADTHLRRIYSKTGVHSRQELIDLGENLERELSGTYST